MPEAGGMGTHERIIHAALALLEEGGRRAVTTRAVSEAAGVQAPAIYRGFGDMEGLLAAAATLRFTDYLVSKRNRPRVEDPVDDLRQGWNLHVEFGLAHPAVYSLMYGDSVRGVAAVAEADAILRGLVQRVAEAGRLRVSVELAAQVVHAAGMGVTLALIETPPSERQPALSETTREAVLRAVELAGDDWLVAFGINTGKVQALFSSHPPLAERIRALENAQR